MSDNEQQAKGLTLAALATRLGVHPQSTKRWKSRGLIDFIRIGRFIIVPWPEVERLDGIRKVVGTSPQIARYLRSAASKSLSTVQAARAIGVSHPTLFRWAQAGIIPSWRKNGEYRIPTAEAERLRALNKGYTAADAAERLGLRTQSTLLRWATHIPFEWFPAPDTSRRYDRALIEAWREAIQGEYAYTVGQKLDYYAEVVRQKLGLPAPEATPEEGAPHTA